MRAVLVHLDAGLRLGLGVGVAADVRAAVDDENTLVQLRRHALGNRQTEESGTDDKEVKTSCHRQQGYPTATARLDIAYRRIASDRPRDAAEGCDRLTIPYRHFSPSSHTSTVDHVGIARVCAAAHAARAPTRRSPYIEETSVPNRRRRRLSTAMSAVAALAVASPAAVVAVSDLSDEHQAADAAPPVRPGRDGHRPAQRTDVGAVAGPVAVRDQPAADADGSADRIGRVCADDA